MGVMGMETFGRYMNDNRMAIEDRRVAGPRRVRPRSRGVAHENSKLPERLFQD